MPPKVTGAKEEPVVVKSGQSVRIECEVDGNPPPNITWTFDGHDVSLDDVVVDDQRLTVER